MGEPEDPESPQPSAAMPPGGSLPGQTEVVLGVDCENPTGALALYERAGMHIAQTRLFLEREIGGLP